MTASRPNFLVVMTDQQRADSVSLAPDGWTPRLARFARESVQLSQTYCPSPHCCPSRASFFTGLYPSRHGIWNNILNQQALTRDPKPGTPFWSTALANAGYELHYAGKWHVAYATTPRDYGWQEHFLSATPPRDHHGPTWADYDRRALEPEPTAPRGPGAIRRPGYNDVALYATASAGATDAHDEQVLADSLATLRSLHGSEKPWILYAGFIGPHDPYRVAPEWLAKIPDSACELPPSYADALRDKSSVAQRLRDQLFGQLTPVEVREARRHYLAYCAYEDHLFGQLLDELDRTGAAEDTVVVFLSDHGDYAGDHGLFCKGIAPYRGAYHVPGFVRWSAGQLAAGSAPDSLVSLADFGPTFLDLAGISCATCFTGRSLAPLLRGATPADWRDTLFTQCNGVELYYTQRIVFTRDWKYVFNGFDRDELYDLRADPHEMTNLLASGRDTTAHQPIVRELCRRMWRFCRAEGDDIISDYFTVTLPPFGPVDALPAVSTV